MSALSFLMKRFSECRNEKKVLPFKYPFFYPFQDFLILIWIFLVTFYFLRETECLSSVRFLACQFIKIYRLEPGRGG